MDYSPESLDPSLLNGTGGVDGLLGGSSTLITESFWTMLTIGFVVLNIVAILFVIAYIAVQVRVWKTQSATLAMRKDVAEIKTYLAAITHQPKTDVPSKSIPSDSATT